MSKNGGGAWVRGTRLFPSPIRRSTVSLALRRRALEDRAGHGEVLGSDLPSRRSWPERFDACFYGAMLMISQSFLMCSAIL